MSHTLTPSFTFLAIIYNIENLISHLKKTNVLNFSAAIKKKQYSFSIYAVLVTPTYIMLMSQNENSDVRRNWPIVVVSRFGNTFARQILISAT